MPITRTARAGERWKRAMPTDEEFEKIMKSAKEAPADMIREANVEDDMRRREHNPRYCGNCGADKGNKQYPCPNCDN